MKHWIHFLTDSTPLRHLKNDIDRLQWNVEKAERDLTDAKQRLQEKEKQTEQYLIQQDWTDQDILEAKQKANSQSA